MSDYFWPATSPKAIKQHRCVFCYYPIEIGEIYKRQTGFYEGKAFTNKFHDECFDVLCDEGEGEFMPGSAEPPERLLQKESTT